VILEDYLINKLEHSARLLLETSGGWVVVRLVIGSRVDGWGWGDWQSGGWVLGDL